MLGLSPKIILFDLEYTAWEGSQERNWSGDDEFREVVQIGAIKIETKTFTELDSFSHFIKPLKNPNLSQYFKDLTGISQRQVDSEGMTLESMLEDFRNWCCALQVYSFGGDENVLKENIKLLDIDFSLKTFNFNDVREIFIEHGVNAKEFMSSTITEAFGVKSPYRGHDALGDIRTTALGLKLLSQKIE